MGGGQYLLHAHDSLSAWAEARASRRNTAEAWARFLFEDIICRFGCMICLVCDGGAEFKGAVRILAERYRIAVILSTPYHPEGNGIAERQGQTLKRVLLKAAGDDPRQWSLLVPAAL